MSKSRIRVTSGALIAVALATGGCKREAVTYAVSISTKDLPRSAPYKLLFRGTPVPLTADATELHATFTAAGDQWLSEDFGDEQSQLMHLRGAEGLRRAVSYLRRS
jgi:hypothetical protein